MGVPAAGPMPGHAALHADSANRRGCADHGDHRAGQSLRAVWLPESDGTAEPGRVQGRQGPGAKDLAAGRAEGAAKAASAQSTVAQRRIVRAASAAAHQSRVELRLHDRDDPRREPSLAHIAGRVQPRASCDSSGTALRKIRGDRDLGRGDEAAWRAGAYSLGQRPEFMAEELRQLLAQVGCSTLYIEPGSPWQNGYCESFNGGFGMSASTERSSTHSRKRRS
jgi:hypothetical protein